MSYDIDLCDPVTKEPLLATEPHHMRGGTYCVGGESHMSLNITYNYSAHFRRVFDGDKGIRSIYGMSGAASIPLIEKAISQLGDDVGPNYWEATGGNAKRTLTQLLALARMRPDGIWDGD